jgi:hypothetical protein
MMVRPALNIISKVCADLVLPLQEVRGFENPSTHKGAWEERRV